jgi:membrane-associated PAP2 superfamily phosphatase
MLKINNIIFIKLAFIGLIGISIFNLYPNIDLICANYFYNTHEKLFYLKNSWWLEKFIHIYVKYSIIAFVIISYIFIIYNYKKNSIKNIIISICVTILIPLIISLLKKLSSHACPWDLTLYGGTQELISWWQYAPNAFGKCFPAGHASTGLCVMGISVMFYSINDIKKARFFYIFGIVAGLVLGVSQQARGAHFLSHTLASIYIACVITNIGIYLAKKYALR